MERYIIVKGHIRAEFPDESLQDKINNLKNYSISGPLVQLHAGYFVQMMELDTMPGLQLRRKNANL